SVSIDKWYGRSPARFQEFAETLHVALLGAPGAEQSLSELVTDNAQPAIARATALSMLAAYAPAPADQAIRAGLAADSALVRRAAARAMSDSDPRIVAAT